MNFQTVFSWISIATMVMFKFLLHFFWINCISFKLWWNFFNHISCIHYCSRLKHESYLPTCAEPLPRTFAYHFTIKLSLPQEYLWKLVLAMSTCMHSRLFSFDVLVMSHVLIACLIKIHLCIFEKPFMNARTFINGW